MDKKTKPAAKRGKSVRGKRTLRVLLYFAIPALCIMLFFFGLTVGYVYLGHGDGADVFSWRTWKHMIDLVFAP